MLKKIKDFKLGDVYELSLVVTDSAVKTTKTGKPYLFLELFDGTESVTANVWDWTHSNKPERNDILNLSGRITEYQGNKQLKIEFIERNTILDIMLFAPTGDIDVDDYFSKALKLIDSIANKELQKTTRAIYTDYMIALKNAPGARKIHHAFIGGTLQHSVDTAYKAHAIAKLTPGCSIDLCVAGALLHDIGKIWAYTLDGATIDLTLDGKLFDHIVLGIENLSAYTTDENKEIMMLLKHIIASHHGKLEFGSPMTPCFMEAWIISYADGIDAKCQTIIELNRKATGNYTDKEWTLENKQMLTQKYIWEIMNG